MYNIIASKKNNKASSTYSKNDGVKVIAPEEAIVHLNRQDGR